MRILSIVVAIIAFGAVESSFAAQSGPNAGAQECAAVDDDARRLACYDALFRVDAIREAPAVAASPGPAIADVPVAPAAPATATAATVMSAPPDPTAEFGLTAQQKESRKPPEAREKPLDSIQARVAQADQDRYGLWRLTLDNGQVWLQTEAALGTRFQSGSLVEIRRGSLGSFILEVPGRPVIRVRRVR